MNHFCTLMRSQNLKCFFEKWWIADLFKLFHLKIHHSCDSNTSNSDCGINQRFHLWKSHFVLSNWIYHRYKMYVNKTNLSRTHELPFKKQNASLYTSPKYFSHAIRKPLRFFSISKPNTKFGFIIYFSHVMRFNLTLTDYTNCT